MIDDEGEMTDDEQRRVTSELITLSQTAGQLIPRNPRTSGGPVFLPIEVSRLPL